jgi:DNA-directed RNA polymerase subunit RPC12/RpoP
MEATTLDSHAGTPVAIDICGACQTLWFDAHESPRLSPGSTLRLFAKIGETTSSPRALSDGDVAKCPRCGGRLRLTHDRQRTTPFTYLRCPNGHGRLTTFVDFLKEKDFVKPLTGAGLERLRQQVHVVQCSTCGAPVELARRSACDHCGSPLSTLDLPHAQALVAQLQQADARASTEAVDPTLPLRLARARREAELAFDGADADRLWLQDVTSGGLVRAGLAVVARWLKTR